MGLYASFVLTLGARSQFPKSLCRTPPPPRLPTKHRLPSRLAFPAHLPQAAGKRAPASTSTLARVVLLQPFWGAPHPSQLHRKAPSPGWVSKQSEELTSRHGEARLSSGCRRDPCQSWEEVRGQDGNVCPWQCLQFFTNDTAAALMERIRKTG